MRALTTPSRQASLLVVLFATVLTVLAGGAPAWAHDSTDGSTLVAVGDQRVIVTAAVAFQELGYADTSGDGLIDADELAEQETDVASTLVATVRDHVRIAVDGQALTIIGVGVPSTGEPRDETADGSPYAVLVVASDSHDGDVADIDLAWTFTGPSTTVVLTHPDGAVTGDLSEDGTFSVSLDTSATVASFFGLGVEHIQFGPDHLLFLLVLTLAVAGTTVTRATTWQTVKLVTAFTLGHALSLGLAYFELISLPAWVVEPAISLSIVAAAVLAIRGRATEARPWLAALIGLVHGLGFASSLGSLGVVTSQRAVALAAFNLGIDLAQTAVVLGVVAILWLASRVIANRMVWVRVAGASSAAAVGVFWTATRLMHLPV